MYGTSCDRHTGSLDEPRKPLAFGPSADSGPSKKLWTWHRKMRSFRYVVPCCVYTWTVPWLKRLGNRYNWIGEKMSFVFNELENVWRCMNQWRCEQLTLEDLQGVDGWGAGELCHYFQYMSYVHFLDSPQLLKKRRSNNPGFSVDLFYPPATSASTDPRFHKELGFLKPYRSGSWVTSEGAFVWSSYERWGIRDDVKIWVARDGCFTFT